ncbi:MAG: hypothetical protein P8077_01200 [Gammaproteobacteria bacterium]
MKDILKRILYAGRIQLPKWGVNVEGKHEALIFPLHGKSIRKEAVEDDMACYRKR